MSVVDMNDHRDMHTACAVCKKKQRDKFGLMTLVPHTTNNAIVFIHTKCMGGLPLIALKWSVTSSTLRPAVSEEQCCLQDYLDAWPEDLKEVEHASRNA